MTVGKDLWVGLPKVASDYGLYCKGCLYRSALSLDYGLSAFPNNGHPMVPGEWRFFVSAWECETRLPADIVTDTPLELLLPAAVQIEVADRPLSDAEVALHHSIHVVGAPGIRLSEAQSDQPLAAASELL